MISIEIKETKQFLMKVFIRFQNKRMKIIYYLAVLLMLFTLSLSAVSSSSAFSEINLNSENYSNNFNAQNESNSLINMNKTENNDEVSNQIINTNGSLSNNVINGALSHNFDILQSLKIGQTQSEVLSPDSIVLSESLESEVLPPDSIVLSENVENSILSSYLTIFSEDRESEILSYDLIVLSGDLETVGSVLDSIGSKPINYIVGLEWNLLTFMFTISLGSVLLYFIWCGVLLLFPMKKIKSEYMGIEEYKLYVMVPSLNEKSVVENTIHRFFENNNENFRLIVIDDGSDDGTGEILEKISLHYDNLHIISRTLPNARKGKGNALNEGLKYIKKLEGSNSEKVIIGVIDADAYIKDQDYIKVLSVFNGNSDIAMVQTAVGMNYVNNWLHRMQDLEFQSCIAIISNVRNYLGNAAGGGNGQFFRLSAFGNKDRVWGNSLLEDFELSTRILLEGNKTCFLKNIVVYQEPVGKLKPLIVQRTRWAQGGIECMFKYGKQILKSPYISNFAKFEMFFYMSLPFISAIGVVGHTFSFAYHCFLVFILKHSVNVELIILLTISIIIAIVFGTIYGSKTKYGIFKGFFIGMSIPLYNLLMIPVCYRSIIRFLKSEKKWDKTDHIISLKLDHGLN